MDDIFESLFPLFLFLLVIFAILHFLPLIITAAIYIILALALVAATSTIGYKIFKKIKNTSLHNHFKIMINELPKIIFYENNEPKKPTLSKEKRSYKFSSKIEFDERFNNVLNNIYNYTDKCSYCSKENKINEKLTIDITTQSETIYKTPPPNGRDMKIISESAFYAILNKPIKTTLRCSRCGNTTEKTFNL